MLAACGLCRPDLHSWARVDAAECARQRAKPVEPLAAGAELLSATGPGDDGGRRRSWRSRGASEFMAAAPARRYRNVFVGGWLLWRHNRVARRTLHSESWKAPKSK